MKPKRVYTTIMTVLVLLTVLLPVNVAALSTTSITMTNITSGLPTVGNTFTTDIVAEIHNDVAPLTTFFEAQAIDLWIVFDPNVVGVNDVTVKQGFFDGNLFTGADDVFDESLGDIMPAGIPTECTLPPGQPHGCIHISVSHSGGSGPVTDRRGTVATITWEGRAAGDANFGIASSSTFVDQDGYSISDPKFNPPHPAITLSVFNTTVYNAGLITGDVLLQGQSSHADVTVTAFCDGVISSDVTLAGGSFSLSVPLGTTCIVTAVYPGYLSSEKNIYVETAEDIGATKLRGGETHTAGSSANCVNVMDALRIINRYEDTAVPVGPPNDDPVDINNDGTINIQDLAITAGNFSKCGPTTWTP